MRMVALPVTKSYHARDVAVGRRSQRRGDFFDDNDAVLLLQKARVSRVVVVVTTQADVLDWPLSLSKVRLLNTSSYEKSETLKVVLYGLEAPSTSGFTDHTETLVTITSDEGRHPVCFLFSRITSDALTLTPKHIWFVTRILT